MDEHDYQFKKKHIERFLADGDKVKATIFFRGREMAHPEIGRRILERLIDDLGDVAIAETMPRQEGNQMHTILSQKVGREEAARRSRKAEAITKEAKRDHAETEEHTGARRSASRRPRRASSSAARRSRRTSSPARRAAASAS